MRLAVFVLVGITVGVLGARLCGRGTSPPMMAPTVPASASGSSPASPPPLARWSAAPREPSVLQRDLAPSDRRYNPVALLREEEGITIQEVFEREPRDPTFAPVLEQRAHDALDRVFKELRLDGKVRAVHTECRTLSCYTFIELDDSDVENVYDEVNGILIGDSQSPGFVRAASGKPAGVTIYNLYRPDTRDNDYYRKFLDEATQPALDLAKQRYLKEQDATGR
jgi:hypothetical protein